MSPSFFLRALSAISLFGCLSAAPATAVPRPPNIIVILTDDQGYDDFGFTGNTHVKTPHLDRLAAESVQFTQFQVAPLCAPTRAALLTGRDYLRTGVWGVHAGQDFMRPDEITFADVLKSGGYATAFLGKWHNGMSHALQPWQRGFDQGVTSELYRPEKGVHTDERGRDFPYGNGSWETRLLTDRAINFIREKKGDPFCIYLAFPAVHEPWYAPEDRIEPYRRADLPEHLALLYAMVTLIDENVGRLLHELDTQNLAADTVVFFLSDNGPILTVRYPIELSSAEWTQRNPSGLRGNKGQVWENGTRVPLLARWPGQWPPRQETSAASVIDLHPTLVELAGLTRPADALPLDGRSLVSLLNSPKLDQPQRYLFTAQDTPLREGIDPVKARYTFLPDPSVIHYASQILAVRDNRFKLVKDGAYLKLFDLIEDPREQHDLAKAQPNRITTMSLALEQWYQELLASERPYRMPVTPVAIPGVGRIEIPAKAPSALHGHVQYHQFSTRNWVGPGDAADFAIDVKQGGQFSLSILAHEVATGTILELSAGGRSVRRELVSSGETSIGEIELASGPQLLTARLLSAPSSSPVAIGQLFSIFVTPVR
jgi:arylsulfatase A-like enzyme